MCVYSVTLRHICANTVTWKSNKYHIFCVHARSLSYPEETKK